MLDKIVYAAIGGGLIMAGAGIAYIVSFEGRIAKLETQIGFISGAVNTTVQTTSKPEKQNKPIVKKTMTLPISPSSEIVKSAIANGCANYMKSYNKIVSSNKDFYSGEKERLKALTDQIKLLGCDKVLK